MARVYCELPTGLNLGFPFNGGTYILAHGLNENVPDDVWAAYVGFNAGAQLIVERHVYKLDDEAPEPALVVEPEPIIEPAPVAEPDPVIETEAPAPAVEEEN